MRSPNALVEYVDEQGRIMARDRFYDPGLDPCSVYWQERFKRGLKFIPQLAYGCGRPLSGAEKSAGDRTL